MNTVRLAACITEIMELFTVLWSEGQILVPFIVERPRVDLLECIAMLLIIEHSVARQFQYPFECISNAISSLQIGSISIPNTQIIFCKDTSFEKAD